MWATGISAFPPALMIWRGCRTFPRQDARTFFPSHFAMQKAQAALKAYDKKNKDAKDADRMNAAQTAFAGALNGAVESSFNDSSLIRSEAVRVFMDTKVKPYAESKGLPTDVDALNKVRESIEKSNAANYKTSIDTLIASVRESRTYAVSRKTSVDGVAIDTSDFPL
jgi:hypothetical protein